MFGVSLRAARRLQLIMLGLATVTVASTFFPDNADARRYRRHRANYSPPLSTVVVDANSGKVLQAKDADSVRHPASLTKIMTLYLLFERIEAGKLKLDSALEVSEHASEQAPTKLGLRPGQTIRVEDAIKGLVTKSANDAAVVVAEALAGSEEAFAKQMTRKARALGMTKTVYRNASGLPDDEQVTTARDQSILGRAIQDRFPRHYRYFATTSFNFRGRNIRNHNQLLGRVEGVDGIKTGYTRASGFNLVSSVRRGNRHIVSVVLGGRSGRSRDAMMRGLIAEHIGNGATKRTVAAIVERDAGEYKTAQAEPTAKADSKTEAKADSKPDAKTETGPAPSSLSAQARPSAPAAETPAAKPQPMPLSSGVIASEPLAIIPGASDPIQPVRVKTVQVRSGRAKTPAPPVPAETASIPQTRQVAAAETPRAETAARPAAAQTSASTAAPREKPIHGIGHGILGTLPASNTPHASAMASADPWPRPSVSKPASFPAPLPRSAAATGDPPPASAPPKAAARSGWFIQVGAFDDESEARQRLDTAREQAKQILAKAEPFTEPVAKGDKTLYRARFAGFAKDQAEAACRTLKRSAISCITVKN
jgi:D-alanyl-D-alanine carboxypeptidase